MNAAERTGGTAGPGEAPLVLTLDAGGTNFVFNAIKDFKLVLERGIVFPAEAGDLRRSLANLVGGFRQVLERVGGRCVAASFAFPGPADYENGVIGDLENLPAYRGAVPLGRILADELGVPVYINNDGDLFAYGAALHGELRALNEELARRGEARRLASLVGMTLGTGWGCGFAARGEMFVGSSSTGMEIGTCPDGQGNALEETVSRSGLVRLFGEELERGGLRPGHDPGDPRLPEAIARLARSAGAAAGEREAARRAFARFGRALAMGAAWAINLLDPDLVVIGGGLAGAWDLFFPETLAELRGRHRSGRPLVFKRVLDLADAGEREALLRPEGEVMAGKRVGIARSMLDTAEAIMLGAYHVALHPTAGAARHEGQGRGCGP